MKSKNNNLVKQLNNSMNVVNNNVRKVVQNELLINVIRVLLIIYASFIVPMLKSHQLNMVNNNVVRLVILGSYCLSLIYGCYYCCFINYCLRSYITQN